MGNDDLDIKDVLRQILRVLPTLATKADVAEFKAEMAEFKADMVEFKAEMAEFKAEFSLMKKDVAELTTQARITNARLDEQGQTIRALIPTHIAAIPGRSAAE